MGRVRRGGYVFECWLGDYPLRHVHVPDSEGNLLGRVALVTLEPLDDWKPPGKVVEIIRQLVTEGRL